MRIIDASVALKWFVNEPGTEEAHRLLAEDVVRAAPSHVLLEVGEGLLRKFRRTVIGLEQCHRALERLPALVRLTDASALAPSALEVAADAECSFYDALYVAAAVRWNAVLVTADVKLASKVDGTRWMDRLELLRYGRPDTP